MLQITGLKYASVAKCSTDRLIHWRLKCLTSSSTTNRKELAFGVLQNEPSFTEYAAKPEYDVGDHVKEVNLEIGNWRI